MQQQHRSQQQPKRSGGGGLEGPYEGLGLFALVMWFLGYAVGSWE